MPSLWAAGSAFILFTACIISGENQTKQASGDELVAQASDKKEEKKEDKLSQILPHVTFDCGGRTEGYYADIQFDCEVFHYCKPNGERFTFVCPPKSRFNQKHMICDYDRYGMKLCHTAEKYFKLNENLYPKTEDEKNANLNSTPRVKPEEIQQKQDIKSSDEDTKSDKHDSKIKLSFQPRNRDNFKKTLIVTEYYNNQDLSTTQAPVIDDASPTVYKWYTPPVLSKSHDKYKDKYKYSDYYPDYYIDEDNEEDESSENRNSESEENDQNEEEYNTETENQDKTVTTSKYSEENRDKEDNIENENKKETPDEESETQNDNTQRKGEENYPKTNENLKVTKDEPQHPRKYDENIEYDRSSQKNNQEPNQNRYENVNYQYHYERKDNPENTNPVKSYKNNQKTTRPRYEYRNQYNKQPEEEDSVVYAQDKHIENNRDEVDQSEHATGREAEADYDDYRKSNDNQAPEKYHGSYSDGNRQIQPEYGTRNEKLRIPERNQQTSRVHSEKPIVEHTTDPTDGRTVKTTTFFHRYTKKSEQPPHTILYEKVSDSTDSPRQVEYDQVPRQQEYQTHGEENVQEYIEEQEPEHYEKENQEVRRPVKIKLYVKNKPQVQQKEYYEIETDQDYDDKGRVQKAYPEEEAQYRDRQENIPVREEIIYQRDQKNQPVETYADYDQGDDTQDQQNDHYQQEHIRESYDRDPNQNNSPNEEAAYRRRPQNQPSRERTTYKQNQKSRPTEVSVDSHQSEAPSTGKNPNDQKNTQYVYYNEDRGQYRYTPKGKVSAYQRKRLNNGKLITEESPNYSNSKSQTTNPSDTSRQPENYYQSRQEKRVTKSDYSRPRSVPKQTRNAERTRYRSAPDEEDTYIDRFKFRNIPEQSRTLHQEKYTRHVNPQPTKTYRTTPAQRRNSGNSQQDDGNTYETTYHDEHREQEYRTEPKTAKPKKFKIITRRQKRQISSGLPLSQQFQQLLNKLYSPVGSSSRNELNNFRSFINSAVPASSSSDSSRDPNNFRSNVSPYHVYPPSAYSYSNSDIPQNRPFHNRAPIYSEPSYNLSPQHYYRPYEAPHIPPPNNYYDVDSGNRSNEHPSSIESTEYGDRPSGEVNEHYAPPIQSINHSDEQIDDAKKPDEAYSPPDSQKFPELHEYPFFNPDFPFSPNGNNSDRDSQGLDFPYLRSHEDNYQIPDLGVYFDPYGELGVTPLYDTSTSADGNKDHSTTSPENEEHRNINSAERPEKHEYSNDDDDKNHEGGNPQSGSQYHVTPPSYLQRNKYATPSVLSLFVTPPPFIRNHRDPPLYGNDFFNPPIRYPFTTTSESPLTETTERYNTQQDNSLITPEPTTEIPEIPVTRPPPKRPHRRRQKVQRERPNSQSDQKIQQELVKPSQPPHDRSASRYKPEPANPPVQRPEPTRPPVRHSESPKPTVRYPEPSNPTVRHPAPPKPSVKHPESPKPPVRHQPPPPRSPRPRPKPATPPPTKPPQSDPSESDSDDEINPFRGNVPFGTRLKRPPPSSKRSIESNERAPSTNVSRKKRVHQSAASDRSLSILNERGNKDRVAYQNVQTERRPHQPRRASQTFRTATTAPSTSTATPIIIFDQSSPQKEPFVYTNVQRYSEDQLTPLRPLTLITEPPANTRQVIQENASHKRTKLIRRRPRVHHPRRGFQGTTEFSRTQSTTTESTTEIATTPPATPSTTVTEELVTGTVQPLVSEQPTEVSKKRVYTSLHGGSLRNENVINRLKTKQRLFTFGRPIPDFA